MKYSKISIAILSSFLFFLLLTPAVSSAAFTSIINPDQCHGILQCVPGARYCTICDGLNATKNVMDYLGILGLVVAVLIITYGGILIMVGGAMPAKIQEGRKAITGAIVGVILMLTSWIIINQVFFLIVNNSVTGKPWNQIDCPAEESLTCIGGKGTDLTSGGGVGGQCNNNGTCEAGENPTGCPSDCAQTGCGNNRCDTGEDQIICPKDCGSEGQVFNDADARRLLNENGITVNKANCTSPGQTNCTSLDGLDENTIGGLIRANQVCQAAGQGNCVMVTGGTEAGHASHGTGHPNTVDVAYNSSAVEAFKSNGLRINANFQTGVTCEPPGGGSGNISCGPGAGVMHIEFP